MEIHQQPSKCDVLVLAKATVEFLEMQSVLRALASQIGLPLTIAPTIAQHLHLLSAIVRKLCCDATGSATKMQAN